MEKNNSNNFDLRKLSAFERRALASWKLDGLKRLEAAEAEAVKAGRKAEAEALHTLINERRAEIRVLKDGITTAEAALTALVERAEAYTSATATEAEAVKALEAITPFAMLHDFRSRFNTSHENSRAMNAIKAEAEAAEAKTARGVLTVEEAAQNYERAEAKAREAEAAGRARRKAEAEAAGRFTATVNKRRAEAQAKAAEAHAKTLEALEARRSAYKPIEDGATVFGLCKMDVSKDYETIVKEAEAKAAEAVYRLASIVGKSVLKTCIDPQGKAPANATEDATQANYERAVKQLSNAMQKAEAEAAEAVKALDAPIIGQDFATALIHKANAEAAEAKAREALNGVIEAASNLGLITTNGGCNERLTALKDGITKAFEQLENGARAVEYAVKAGRKAEAAEAEAKTARANAKAAREAHAAQGTTATATALILAVEAVKAAEAKAKAAKAEAKTAEAEAHEFMNDTLADGADITQQAATEILDVLNEYGSAEAEAEAVKPRKRVLYNINAEAEAEAEAVKAGQLFYRRLRAYIDGARALAVVTNGYSYLTFSELSGDYENEFLDGVYYRAQKYADIGGYSFDYNHKAVSYTASAEAVKALEKTRAEVLNAMNAKSRARLEYVLKARERGMTTADIARALNVSTRRVQYYYLNIQKAAEAAGFTPRVYVKEATKTAYAAKGVTCYTPQGAQVAIYTSVKQAARACGCSRQAIIKAVQNGTTARGYKWKRLEANAEIEA